MALNDTQQNIASEMRTLAISLLQARAKMDSVAKMWSTEGMFSLTDEEWAELSSFAGITQAEMQAVKGAFDNLLTTLGNYDDSPQSDATKLLKICNVVP